MKNMTVTEWCHHFLAIQVRPGDLCIDATAGNGHDTRFLAELVGEQGTVLAFDIQQNALHATAERIQKAGCSSRVRLIHDGHEHLASYAEKESVSCIVFNLGYLPGGSHEIATKAETTIPAISAGLSLLKPQGLMTLCVYHGGDTGFGEREEVFRYLKALDPKKYLVIISSYYNRPNMPPDLVLVIRL